MKKLICLALIITVCLHCKNSNKSCNANTKQCENKVEKCKTQPCNTKNENAKSCCKQNENKSKTCNSNSGDWVMLFDGSNLNQWRGYRKDKVSSNWTIENGTLAFHPNETNGNTIITKEKYTNFILSLEWKISEGGNSGIFWGVFEDDKFGEAYQTGPEIQILDNAKHPDALVGNGTHKAGSLYDMIVCPDNLINPAGAWNLCVLEINQETNLGKVTMNNIEVFTFPLHGNEWDAMVEKSKFKGWEGFGKYKTGYIGLQDHGDAVWFRNIKIKTL